MLVNCALESTRKNPAEVGRFCAVIKQCSTFYVTVGDTVSNTCLGFVYVKMIWINVLPSEGLCVM